MHRAADFAVAVAKRVEHMRGLVVVGTLRERELAIGRTCARLAPHG